ncbi:hypothetical protein LUZ61_017580 [Rhynchospora tenuis]|uniref:C3H1-type domain-containing protein n=1 Tax=Rhynchospora tenuis TaxID=198213 RepID=A0AAD5Z7N8_9POAL|nr:hypothetical protein LUZ61_017580 [Rhynchospora tenuis]
MDYSSSAITIVPDAGPMWATDDDYRAWAGDTNPNSSQSRDGSEQPPNKKSRSDSNNSNSNTNPVPSSTSKSRAIGKMFFKTKLCCKFRAGTCPYITNCNFAHGMEELRKPPPNWQEILAAAQLEQNQRQDEGSFEAPREEHSIPILTSSNVGGEGQRNYKGRHCKKFYTEEGCPYGESCTFLHDEQSKARESVAISLSPTVGGGAAAAAAGFGTAQGAAVAGQKPSNWKTRICNKWEMTGYCPFGSKCHFAHGSAELHKYGGGLVDTDGKEVTTPDSKQAGVVSLKSLTENPVASSASAPHVDVYHAGVPSQRLQPIVSQRPVAQAQRPIQKWRGPDKISRIYGDWIDETD